MEIEKYRKLIFTNLILGWIHLIAFGTGILFTLGGIVYWIYDTIENMSQIQNLVVILVVGFFSLTVFGSLTYGAHEFVRGLKTQDHHRMLMFRICIIVIILSSCGYSCYMAMNLYDGTFELEEDNNLCCLVVPMIAIVLEICQFILAYIVYNKVRNEKKRLRVEKHNRRKLNSVAAQLSILKPAYLADDDQEKAASPKCQVSKEETHVEEVICEKKDKRNKKSRSMEKIEKFLESEKHFESTNLDANSLPAPQGF